MLNYTAMEFGGKVCDALGLDKEEVKSFKITVDVNEPIIMEVFMYKKIKDDGVIEILKKYKLVDIE